MTLAREPNDGFVTIKDVAGDAFSTHGIKGDRRAASPSRDRQQNDPEADPYSFFSR